MTGVLCQGSHKEVFKDLHEATDANPQLKHHLLSGASRAPHQRTSLYVVVRAGVLTLRSG